MNVAFDSRPGRDAHGVGRYTRCLLDALRETAAADGTIFETPRPHRADVFHAPWMDGALLHSPCPMVVTLHDLAALKRRSEHLRTGVRPRLRQLAVQRAVRVIVPTRALAEDAQSRLGVEPEQIDVIHEAPAACMYERSQREIAEVRAALCAARALPAVGRRPAAPRSGEARREARGDAARAAACARRLDEPMGA